MPDPTDLFSRGADWLSDKLERAGTERSITLSDSPDAPTITLVVPATPGEPGWNEAGYDSLVNQLASHWLVRTSHLITDDGLQLPRRGWIITDSLDNARYECTSQGDDPPWEWCDSGHRRVRIRTQTYSNPYT